MTGFEEMSEHNKRVWATIALLRMSSKAELKGRVYDNIKFFGFYPYAFLRTSYDSQFFELKLNADNMCYSY